MRKQDWLVWIIFLVLVCIVSDIFVFAITKDPFGSTMKICLEVNGGFLLFMIFSVWIGEKMNEDTTTEEDKKVLEV